jgi:D-glycero-D-manno-heptose 1,7-bisphosphate phosphatase
MRGAFIDRDGVINKVKLHKNTPLPPSKIDEIEILEGVLEAITLLTEKKFVPIVVTNQPDIARGLYSREHVDSINQRISQLTGIKHFYVCPHDENQFCNCRKPKPGLIKQAVLDLNLTLDGSIVVGDRWRDIEAGQTLKINSYFIDYSYEEKQPSQPFTRVLSLIEAVRLILGGNENESR